MYLKEEFLRKLKKGDHDIKIVLEDGSIATGFTIIKEGSWIPWACGTLGLALAAFLAWFFLKKKKESGEES